jgi:hypothetical protein
MTFLNRPMPRLLPRSCHTANAMPSKTAIGPSVPSPKADALTNKLKSNAVRATTGIVIAASAVVAAGNVVSGSALAAAVLPVLDKPFNGCASNPGRTISVFGPSNLSAALSNAQPGDQILLASGNYGKPTYSKNGTASKPIVIKAASGARVTMDGFNFGGSYGILSGITFNKGTVVITGHHNRVTRSRFNNARVDASGGQHAYNRVDHNDFASVQGMAVEINVKSNATEHQGWRIDHNYFHDHRVSDTEEVVRILTDQFDTSNVIIEYNLFDKVQIGASSQREVISLKTAGGIIRGNTITNTPLGTLAFRETSRSIAEGNYLAGNAKLRIFGDDHIVRGNRLEASAEIVIGAGDGVATQSQCDVGKKVAGIRNGGRCVSMHAAARNVKVYDNIGQISVGGAYSGDNVPAQNTQLWNNSGAVKFGKNSSTQNRGGSATNNTARKLTPSDVGPNAPDPSCQ